MKTQKDAVLWHLKTHGSITSWEAIKEYGITRLAHQIYVLRKEGVNITDQTVPFTTRFGRQSSYSKYIYSEPGLQLNLIDAIEDVTVGTL